MMAHEIKKYTVEDVSHLHGDVLTSVAMDKRQDDRVRKAALQKSRNTMLLTEIMNDVDDSRDLRNAAKEILQEESIVLSAMASDETQEE